MGDPAQLYTKLFKVGKGSYGSVFKGIEKATNKVFAIKVIDADNDEDELDEIQREILLLSRCNHPNVTRYYGSYLQLEPFTLWIIMDYCGGGSVRQMLKPGPLSEKYIAIIAREVLQGLAYLHANRIIHRDVKAANILLTESGDVKLCDFGVSGQLSLSTMKRSTFVGTPCWMAPEVIVHDDYDFKADIWSFGIMIYELVMGDPPLSDIDPMRALYLIPRNAPPRLEGAQSKQLKELVKLALQPLPAERPTATDLSRTALVKSAKKGTSLLRELIVRYEKYTSTGHESSDDEADTITGAPAELKINVDSNADQWVFDEVLETNAAEAVTKAQTHLTLKREKEKKEKGEKAKKKAKDKGDALEAGSEGAEASPRRKSEDPQHKRKASEDKVKRTKSSADKTAEGVKSPKAKKTTSTDKPVEPPSVKPADSAQSTPTQLGHEQSSASSSSMASLNSTSATQLADEVDQVVANALNAIRITAARSRSNASSPASFMPAPQRALSPSSNGADSAADSLTHLRAALSVRSRSNSRTSSSPSSPFAHARKTSSDGRESGSRPSPLSDTAPAMKRGSSAQFDHSRTSVDMEDKRRGGSMDYPSVTESVKSPRRHSDVDRPAEATEPFPATIDFGSKEDDSRDSTPTPTNGDDASQRLSDLRRAASAEVTSPVMVAAPVAAEPVMHRSATTAGDTSTLRRGMMRHLAADPSQNEAAVSTAAKRRSLDPVSEESESRPRSQSFTSQPSPSASLAVGTSLDTTNSAHARSISSQARVASTSEASLERALSPNAMVNSLRITSPIESLPPAGASTSDDNSTAVVALMEAAREMLRLLDYFDAAVKGVPPPSHQSPVHASGSLASITSPLTSARPFK